MQAAAFFRFLSIFLSHYTTSLNYVHKQLNICGQQCRKLKGSQLLKAKNHINRLKKIITIPYKFKSYPLYI